MDNKTRQASLPLGAKPSGAPKAPTPKRRYGHYMIFIALVVSSFFNIQALWGLFFIGLTLPAYRNRAVFFLDMIERDKEPFFYWAVFVTWIGFGVLMIWSDWAVIQGYF